MTKKNAPPPPGGQCKKIHPSKGPCVKPSPHPPPHLYHADAQAEYEKLPVVFAEPYERKVQGIKFMCQRCQNVLNSEDPALFARVTAGAVIASRCPCGWDFKVAKRTLLIARR